jgi:hypothetical protein
MGINRRCPGPMHRREFLKVGALALGGLSLADVLQARAASGQERTDTSVIFLYLVGGPSQLETYELFPLQARLADKFSLVRSVRHTMNAHNDGGIEVLTGKTPTRPDPTSTSRSEHPCFGAVTSRMRGRGSHMLPPYVGIPSQLGMVSPTYLGLHHAAFAAGNPTAENYGVPSLRVPVGLNGERLSDRRFLRDRFDALRREIEVQNQFQSADQFRDLAFQMLGSRETESAFAIGTESDRLRDRYGHNVWGQGCLLARRLAEAGTAAITVTMNTPKTGQEFTNWDDHIMNAMRPGHFGDYMRVRLPYLDQALSALIEDVFDRGLDERILIVVMGEFGRTPRLSRNAQGVGRDHWPEAQSVLLSGGGLKMGQVIGATNSRAEYPTQQPLTPKDILATIYQHLGIDHRHNFLDHTGRPIPILSEGAPIADLV